MEEIADHLKVSTSTYLRKVLSSLEEKGYITSIKRGRARYYCLDAAAL